MKKINRPALPEIKTIEVVAGVRYWEDSEVDGVADDESGSKMPLRDGDVWRLQIDAATGEISDWPKGIAASIHYKVCDQFSAKFYDSDGKVVVEMEDEYVPSFMCPADNGYGDYIVMEIDGAGRIQGWKFKDAMVTSEDDE